MTPFGLLLKLSGLKQAEAAAFLDVAPVTIDKMARGARSTPSGIMAKMRALIADQQRAADEMLDFLDQMEPPEVEIGYPADDVEAQHLGLPTVSAWSAMIARVVAELDVPVILTPRGASIGTAKAADMRESEA